MKTKCMKYQVSMTIYLLYKIPFLQKSLNKTIWHIFKTPYINVISDSDLCPTNFYKLYMDKLNPKINWLWQKPRRGRLHYNDPVWFEPRNVGHDPLERFMKHMSVDIELNDLTYTNHCIHSTVLNELGGKYEARHLMSLSSHKSESSIKQYAVKCPENKKKEMFDDL